MRTELQDRLAVAQGARGVYGQDWKVDNGYTLS